jgi:hypothetical protein
MVLSGWLIGWLVGWLVMNKDNPRSRLNKITETKIMVTA